VNPDLGGELSPDIEEASRTIARRNRWTIIPSGPWAANLLGLSTQVPAKIVYLSDGPSKKVSLGRRYIQFKHARPQSLGSGDRKSVLVVQALRYLGKDGVDDQALSVLRRSLSGSERKQLLKNTRFGVDWIHRVAKKLAEVHS
jgi:RNase P/RNase MRP subunit POP5